MNVLLLGSGGREHALAWALSASPLLTRLLAAPGNPGICEIAECVPLDLADHAAIIRLAQERDVGLVVIGPETPLVAGLADDLDAAGLRAFGPSREAARLEGSKTFTKALALEAGVPTARYAAFEERAPALAYVAAQPLPIVVKADGLAAGKGVTIAQTREEAEAAVDAAFDGAFGTAGATIVVEEFLRGEEASLFALCDGRTVVPFGTAQDHKRAFDGDRGPNTGGMGAVSPAPVLSQALAERAMREIVEPTLEALARRGAPYRGVLYAGLMVTEEGPKLIEYNVRFGDPEAQVLMMRLKDDLLTLLNACVDGVLDRVSVRWREGTAVTVVMAAKGYPGPHATGSEIRGVDAAAALPGVEVFHAGTRREGGRLFASGGRVLAVTASGRDAEEARERAYHAVGRIEWPEGFWRSDIGRRAVEETRG